MSIIFWSVVLIFSYIESSSSIPPWYSVLMLPIIYFWCDWQSLILYLLVEVRFQYISRVSLNLALLFDVNTSLFWVSRIISMAISAEDSKHFTCVLCYGVGHWARRILQVYWYRLRMVARAGGYYRTTFQGFLGVTQGNPLSPTIFNVVVDAVVRHCAAVVEERAGGKHGRR